MHYHKNSSSMGLFWIVRELGLPFFIILVLILWITKFRILILDLIRVISWWKDLNFRHFCLMFYNISRPLDPQLLRVGFAIFPPDANSFHLSKCYNIARNLETYTYGLICCPRGKSRYIAPKFKNSLNVSEIFHKF